MREAGRTVRARYVGADGCRAGWFYIGLDGASGWTLGLAPTAGELLRALPAARRVLIDMPIGLRDSGGEPRRCDTAARRVLGRPRAASVFPPPARPVLRAGDYREADRLNRRLTGRGLTRQAWNLVPKLRELDELMRRTPRARALVRESHPEVCFWALNGGRAMAHGKKTPAGRREREVVLRRHLPATPTILAEALARYRRAQVGRDDVLDALALAVTARCRPGALRSLPDHPETDACGLPMEIVCARIDGA